MKVVHKLLYNVKHIFTLQQFKLFPPLWSYHIEQRTWLFQMEMETKQIMLA